MKSSLFILILSLLLFSACRLPTAELTNEEEEIVDTIYAREYPPFRLVLDSICNSQKDSLRQRAVDSLVELQLIERKKLISRE